MAGKLVSGILIGLVCLFFVFQGVEWSRFQDNLIQADDTFILLAILAFLLKLFFLVKRWQIILHPIRQLPFFRGCFIPYMTGYSANMLMQLHAGEFLRTWLTGSRFSVPKTEVFSLIIYERLIDLAIMALLSLLMIYLTTVQIPLELQTGSIFLFSGVCLVFAAFWAVGRYENLSRNLPGLIGLLPKKLQKPLNYWLATLLKTTVSKRSGWNIVQILLHTMFMWLFTFWMIQCLLQAFHIQIPWYAPVFIMVISNLGMMAFSPPAHIGMAHFLYVFSLKLFHVGAGVALGFAVVTHALIFSIILLIGGYSIHRAEIPLAQLKSFFISPSARTGEGTD